MVSNGLTFGGSQLNGHIFAPQGASKRGVLFIHGWNSDSSGYKPRAMAVTDLGYTAMTFDLRGHGKSPGNRADFTFHDHLSDVEAAAAHLGERLLTVGDTPPDITVVAASYGGALATVLTGSIPVSALVLRAPSLYADDDLRFSSSRVHGDSQTREYLYRTLGPRDNQILTAACGYKGSVMLVRGRDDERVPMQALDNYRGAFEVSASRLRIEHVPNTGHKLETEEQKRAFINLLRSFLAEDF